MNKQKISIGQMWQAINAKLNKLRQKDEAQAKKIDQELADANTYDDVYVVYTRLHPQE